MHWLFFCRHCILDSLSVDCIQALEENYSRCSLLHRRRYAGFAIHLGFVAIAVGITGSSLGTQRWETTMQRGETVSWAGRSIRFAALDQQRYPDKLAIEAELEISSAWRRPISLRPAQYLYLLQNQWATKVAIDSSLSGDFYVILDSGRGEDQIHVTFVENPLMCWIWWGGTLIGLSTLVALWPVRFKSTSSASTKRIQRREIHEPIVGAPPPHVYPLPAKYNFPGFQSPLRP